MTDLEASKFLNDTLSNMRREIEIQSATLEEKITGLEKVQNYFIAPMVANSKIRDGQVNAKFQESIESSIKVYTQLIGIHSE